MYCKSVLLLLLMGRWTEESFFEGIVKDQKEFVEMLEAIGYITYPRVKEAMLQIDRKIYKYRSSYEDYPTKNPQCGNPKPPNMQAFALHYLYDKLKEGSFVLDVASGSGYMAACMAVLVNETGLVVGLHATVDNMTNAKSNVLCHNPQLMEYYQLTFVDGDLELGYPDVGPYDAIHVGQIFKEVPEAYFAQLKNKGRLMIPIGCDKHFNITIYDKLKDGNITSYILRTLDYETEDNSKCM